MDRLFLDANVLFSAAYRERAGLLRLWDEDSILLITSGYAAAEARRNLTTPEQRARLDALLERVHLVLEGHQHATRDDLLLPEKDRPMLLAAAGAGATHLITGDVTHFGRYFSKRLLGVLVMRPAEYLATRTP